MKASLTARSRAAAYVDGGVCKFLSMIGNCRSEYSAEIRAARSGFIVRIDALKIGHAGVQLGVGRNRAEDPVSPVAGVQFHKKSGGAVKAGDLVMTVYAKDDPALGATLPQLEEAVEYGDEAPDARKLIWKEVA
ncbi:MAG: hypothetical protein LBD58_11325 [Treponema sp.]|nr:hypothetical protein [Treponema sp.]